MTVRSLIILISVFLITSCITPVSDRKATKQTCYASYFDILDNGSVVTISPDNQRDTFAFETPVRKIVCMSSSNVACLEAIGADSLICAVSGLRFLHNESLRKRGVPDVGYDALLDYEKLAQLSPDVVIAYQVGPVKPPCLVKLQSMGLPVIILYEHLENHPLARAEYVRFFGALTGRQNHADDFFSNVSERYDSLAVKTDSLSRKAVLINAPYGDSWYVPGKDNYMNRLIKDAGGYVLGAADGETVSRSINIEEAYGLSLQADIWLNPGNYTTLPDLVSSNGFFRHFGPVKNNLPIYNNTLKLTDFGGNDFWERGTVRPDLILEDFINAFNNNDGPYNYLIRLQ